LSRLPGAENSVAAIWLNSENRWSFDELACRCVDEHPPSPMSAHHSPMNLRMALSARLLGRAGEGSAYLPGTGQLRPSIRGDRARGRCGNLIGAVAALLCNTIGPTIGSPDSSVQSAGWRCVDWGSRPLACFLRAPTCISRALARWASTLFFRRSSEICLRFLAAALRAWFFRRSAARTRRLPSYMTTAHEAKARRRKSAPQRPTLTRRLVMRRSRCTSREQQVRGLADQLRAAWLLHGCTCMVVCRADGPCSDHGSGEQHRIWTFGIGRWLMAPSDAYRYSRMLLDMYS
jgi:hypothetical protein